MNKTLRLIATLASLPAAALAAPVPVTGTMNYLQNFDTLGSASVAWTNDSTIPGWYAQINNGATATGSAQAANGSTVLSGLLNLGATGAADRALGSKATGTGNIANIACAVLFQNTGTKPVALSQVNYIGEIWRTNSGTGTPLVAVNEEYSVFYQVSNTAITNILSGAGNATPAAGAGFTVLTGADWTSPVNSPLGTQLDGNLAANRQAVSASPAGIMLLPGQFLMLKWTDANEAGTDGFQGIDSVSIQFTELNGVLSPAVSGMTRLTNGTPANPADDTFGFTVTVAGSGSSIGTGWTTTDVSAPNATSATYGTPVVWSGFPVTGPKAATFTDNGTPAFTASLSVDPPRIIGTNALAGNHVITADTPPAQWVIDETLQKMTMNDGGGAPAKTITAATVDLSSVSGQVRFSAVVNTVDSSSGFESADTFLAQLHLNDGTGITTVNLITPHDTDSSGVLEGVELADDGESKTLQLSHIIPDNFVSAQLVISGNTDSANETITVSGIRFELAPPALSAVAGLVTVNNQATAAAADDTFSVPVTITPGNNAPSTGWTSDTPPPAGGFYAGLNPAVTTFGPYAVTGGARTITLTDNAHPAAQAILTLTPPTPSLAAAAATNIVRNENGPGVADDTVSFDTVISGPNAGPGWTATGGATPASGNYGSVTFTVPAGPASVTLTITDVSYPAATQDLTVTLPARYVIGWQYYGGSLLDVVTPVSPPPAPAWINDPVAHTLDMNTGGTSDKVVVSEVINLSAIGSVDFSATFRARETSTGSNFETLDRFKAELVIDGGTPGEQIVNLVSAWDTGDGASNVPPAPNGAPNGFINGYQGTATTAPLDTTLLEYNDQKARDEFNTGGANGDAVIDNTFALSHTIPVSANSVQLRIYGAGIATSEFFTVSNVVFTSIPASQDSDSDGITDLNELGDGTDPHNPASVFGITGITPDPGNPGAVLAAFPTVAGRVYRGYYSTDLATWTRDDSHPLVTGDGSSQAWPLVPEPAPGTRRYLRVIVGRQASDFPATLP